MKLGCLFSGGKDSTYALYLAQKYHKIVCLLNIDATNTESMMFHVPNAGMIHLQAECLQLPLIAKKTKGTPEQELDDLKDIFSDAKKKYNIQGIVTGAVGSTYQATRIQKICDELNLVCFNPLWLKPQLELLNELVTLQFDIHIVGVAAYPLDETYLGKKIDESMIKTLEALQEKHGIHPAGEGGEIETLVLNAPHFKKRIDIVTAKTEYSNHHGMHTIQKAQVTKK